MAQSSSSSTALKKLEEQITCPICLELFNNENKIPKLLPCSHSFCFDCLQRVPLVLEEGKHCIDCPTCRLPCPVPVEGVASLPPSFVVNNLMEVYDLMNMIADHQHVSCGNCSNTNADRYCRQCSMFYCPDCLTYHNNLKVNASHKLLSIEEVSSIAHQLCLTKPGATMRCSNHNEPLDLYCVTCEQLICRDCTIKKHKDDNYDLVSDIYQQHKGVIVSSSLCPLNNENDRLQLAKQELINRQNAISQEAERIKEKIRFTVAERKKRLDKEERKLIADVDSATTRKFHVLGHQLSDIDSEIGQVAECKDYVDVCIKVCSPQEVLVAKSQLMDRTQTVIAGVKDKTFEPLEQLDIELATTNAIPNIGELKCSFLSIPSAKVSYGCIPIINQECMVTASFIASNGLLVPVPSSLVKCHLTLDNAPHVPQCSVKKASQSGMYKVAFTPLCRGLHKLHIAVDDCAISASPFNVPVTVPPAMRVTPIKTIPKLHEPSGVAVTKDQLVVVSEAANGHCITVLDKDGNKIRSFGSCGANKGQLHFPRGVVITPKGTILVADCDNHRIQEFTIEGECLSCVGTRGKGDLQFSYPRGLAINKTTGEVFVADTNNNRVQVLSTNLTFSRAFGSYGSGRENFHCPHDVAIDSQGFFYVTDCNNHRVQKFSAAHQFITSFGTHGSEPGQLNCPSGITVDDNNLLYINNGHNNYITIYTTDGEHNHSTKNTHTRSWYFNGITIDQNGELLVCCAKDNTLKVF